MQKIFYNANVITYDKNMPTAQAFLVNDGNIVLVGSNEEVMAMKTEDTKIINIKGRTILPSFFDTNAKVYDIIENRLKDGNKFELIEDNDEVDENYEKFDKFKAYKNQFLVIQNEFLAKGITTIFEMNLNPKEFTFWKKMADTKELKIDVIGYIDILHNKDIMDNNCKSYRKYKNHFRLGGYYLNLDGKLSKKKAWLSKPYKGEKTYVGYSNVGDEQLSYLIKTALEEKKQFIIETNGDKALEQFLRCFKENIEGKEDLDGFRPIAKNCNFISKKHLLEMKELGISPSFQIKEIEKFGAEYKKSLGLLRATKIQPMKLVKDKGMEFLINTSKDEIPNIFELALVSEKRVYDKSKTLGKKNAISYNDALNSLIVNSSYFSFDLNTKGTIENGKKANFVILTETLDEIKNKNTKDPILHTYIEGEEVFSKFGYYKKNIYKKHK